MWEMYEHPSSAKQIDSAPEEILKRYEKWKDIVRISGPQALREIRGFRDEALRGEWIGHRSSRVHVQDGVIYCIEKEAVIVQIVSVTTHDYRRN